MQSTRRKHRAPWVLLGLLSLTPATAEMPDVHSAISAGERNVTSKGTGTTALSTGSPNTVLPAPPRLPSGLDDKANTSYSKALQGYYDYVGRGYLYRSRVFEWQLFSSRLIFGIVITLVLSGLSFAAVQFYVAMIAAVAERDRQTRSKTLPSDNEATTALASELGITEKGITVKSSVLGVVILALSLAFFYLYLVYVYPIHESI